MLTPLWGIVVVLFVALAGWTILLATRRNPLPFPDHGSRIFTAASAEGKAAVVALLARHGVRERFQVNTAYVLRSIMWDGTIINYASTETMRRLDSPSASIGMVVADPSDSVAVAAAFLTSRGFSARVVLDAEPELPIAFVITNAMHGTVLNFRKHVVHMPRPHAVAKDAR